MGAPGEAILDRSVKDSSIGLPRHKFESEAKISRQSRDSGQTVTVRFSELLAHPGVEEEVILRSRFGFMAFHGGNLERMTDEIASSAADAAGASLYAVRQPAPMKKHIASTKVRAEESDALASFLEHVDVVIAVHGYGRDGLWQSLLLGGQNRPLALHVGDHLRTELPEFSIVDDVGAIPVDLAGQHRDNPVNKPPQAGVQIELPPRVRGLTPHALTMERINGRIAWTNSLIRALTNAALSWPAPFPR
jgi:phage replication-related protein YjqB (UPF0714/DUF867 family)